MKQLLFMLMLLMGAVGSANAQVCKISNTNDNVEVFSTSLTSPNQVTVVVSNDSKEISANVTVIVKVTYDVPGGGGIAKDHNFTGKGLAKPNESTAILINIPEKDTNNRVAKSVEAISISGTKCLTN